LGKIEEFIIKMSLISLSSPQLLQIVASPGGIVRIALVAMWFSTAGPILGAFATKSNSTTAFVDDAIITRSITFTAADFENRTIIGDLNLTIAFAKSNDQGFVPSSSAITPGTPYLDEIEFILSSPSGTSVRLVSNDGSWYDPVQSSFNNGNSGFQGEITFDQDASTHVNANRDQLVSGTYLPANDLPGQTLDAFNGESVVGTWELSIEDDEGLDGISFYSYSLAVHTRPEPRSATLWGTLGLLTGSILLARRRRPVPGSGSAA